MMIAHIFPVEKFTEPYVNFINTYFSNQTHTFYLYGNYENADLKISNKSNVKVFRRKRDLLLNMEFRRSLKQAQNIIIHNFNELPVGIVITQPSIKKKSAVVFWGGDIYIHRLVLEGTKNKLVRIIEYFKKKALRGIPLFLTFCHDDYMLAKEWYGIEGKSIDILYPSTVNKDEIESVYKEKKLHTHDGINIMIGNSATASNQHIEALDYLRHFRDQDINIFVPLAYGDMDYREQVIDYGKNIYGEKFHPITDFMSPDEYARFLSSIDIAIFNNDRQQATGNIEIVAYLGAKVYLRQDTVMWDHYVGREERRFFPVNEIENESIDDFSRYAPDDYINNHQYFSNIWDDNHLYTI